MNRPTEELLQDYLDGRLSQEERREFEALLERDADLAGQVEACREFGRALRHDLPELPPGFYTRARARFEESQAPKKPRFFRLLSWEMAGLAAAAALSQGRTRFFNVENLRHKECDRITDFLAALRELGVKGEERRDELIIEGNPEGYPGGTTVSGQGDHRVIMALTIVGLRCRAPITITGAEHVAKSYPDFFGDLRRLGARIEEQV